MPKTFIPFFEKFVTLIILSGLRKSPLSECDNPGF